MGRKSIERTRKPKTEKVEYWTQALIGKLKRTELMELTMDDLARLMDKSKSTVYQYFKTKEELFEYITGVRIDKLKAYKQELTANQSSIIDQYEAFSNIILKGTKDLSPFFLHQLQLVYPSSWQMIELFLKELLKDLQDFYALGMKNGLFVETSLEMLSKLDEYFIKQLIIDYQFFDSHNETLESAIQSYLQLKFEGLLIRP